MRAEVGDSIVVHGHKVGQKTRRGVVVDVHGQDGAPPFVVRWDDDPEEHIFYPGSDALIG